MSRPDSVSINYDLDVELAELVNVIVHNEAHRPTVSLNRGQLDSVHHPNVVDDQPSLIFCWISASRVWSDSVIAGVSCCIP